jgi:hypothetical protein
MTGALIVAGIIQKRPLFGASPAVDSKVTPVGDASGGRLEHRPEKGTRMKRRPPNENKERPQSVEQ